MIDTTKDLQLRQRLSDEFGEEQSVLILDLFCSSVGIELNKVRQSAEAQNQRRLLHNSRGLRGVCQSVFVDDMAQTCQHIESAAGLLDWPLVTVLVARLEGEFESLRNQYQ